MELGISGGALREEIRIPADVFMRFRDSGQTWIAGATAPADRSGPVYLLTEYLIVPDRRNPVPIVTWTYYPARSGERAVARFSQTNSPSNEWWTPHPEFERFISATIADAISAQGRVALTRHIQPQPAAKRVPMGILGAGFAVIALAVGTRRWLATLNRGDVRAR